MLINQSIKIIMRTTRVIPYLVPKLKVWNYYTYSKSFHPTFSNDLLRALTSSKIVVNSSTGNYCQLMRYSTTLPINQKKKYNESASSAVTETSADSRGEVSLSRGEKVKENVKTSAYGGIVLIGIAVTAAMAYLILSELFSSDSPNSIYAKSFKLCKASTDVQDVLGEPLKCYGEETRRGWRRHVAHQKFLLGDTKYIRMKFYIEGKFNKGTVHLEKKTNDRGNFEYSYLLVDIDTYPPRRIEVNVTNV